MVVGVMVVNSRVANVTTMMNVVAIIMSVMDVNCLLSVNGLVVVHLILIITC